MVHNMDTEKTDMMSLSKEPIIFFLDNPVPTAKDLITS